MTAAATCWRPRFFGIVIIERPLCSSLPVRRVGMQVAYSRSPSRRAPDEAAQIFCSHGGRRLRHAGDEDVLREGRCVPRGRALVVVASLVPRVSISWLDLKSEPAPRGGR